MPSAFDVATGDPRLAGAIVEIDSATGKAVSIRRVMVGENDVDAGESPARTDHGRQ
jgi:calcineurin-like phosphoesterase